MLDPKTAQRIIHATRKALIVDSSMAGTRMLAELIRSVTSSHVVQAQTMGEAMSLAGTFDPNLIFVAQDAAIDGAALTKLIRKSEMNCRKAPIIMILTEAKAATIVAARDAGVHEFLVKPFTMKDLIRRLEAITLKPRDWVEAVDYIGPDRRRFNSADYKGPQKRKAVVVDHDKAQIEQAVRIVVSAAKALALDPIQVRRALNTQVEALKALAAKTHNASLAQATQGLAAAMTQPTLTDGLLAPHVAALSAFLPKADSQAA